jgi:hypothetical protein
MTLLHILNNFFSLSQNLGVLDPEYLSDALRTVLEEKGKEKHISRAKSVIAAGYTDGSIELFR